MVNKKGKYIRLTETQLNTLIKEEVKKQLQILMEYAEPRKKFVDKCASYFNQILENWCLCRYCTLSGINVNDCHNHWHNELNTCLEAIGSTHIKKNDSFETRNKAIIEGFDMSDAFGGVDFNLKKLIRKFRLENIDYKDEITKQSVTDFCNEVNNIVVLLSKADLSEISDYAYSI